MGRWGEGGKEGRQKHTSVKVLVASGLALLVVRTALLGLGSGALVTGHVEVAAADGGLALGSSHDDVVF